MSGLWAVVFHQSHRCQDLQQIFEVYGGDYCRTTSTTCFTVLKYLEQASTVVLEYSTTCSVCMYDTDKHQIRGKTTHPDTTQQEDLSQNNESNSILNVEKNDTMLVITASHRLRTAAVIRKHAIRSFSSAAGRGLDGPFGKDNILPVRQ